MPFALRAAVVDDPIDAVRAATKRNTTTQTSSQSTTTAPRARTENTTPVSASAPASRTGGTTGTVNSQRERSTVQRTTVEQSRAAQSVAARNAAIQPRNASVTRTSVADRVNRTAVMQPVTLGRSGNITPAMSVARSATGSQSTPRISRAATTNISRAATMVGDVVLTQKDYKVCREVYYNCMDEFCANKDSQLKRCACSSRMHDFDLTKKKMSNFEDKMLDFNERLLTVNMEKEDAMAIAIATAGELAYQKTDKSDSKKMLDEISKKLSANTSDEKFNRNLSAISLSLDTANAFDNIDSMMGASTTVKEGPALYNAALPICREMVAEVCDEDSAAIAESGYQMAVEQDCNTVARTYETMQDQALMKLREGSALLEMSRLDIHQKRNSDDILTCKKKMLDMLADSSVCGADLGKCLDTTGRYIDPATGQAFLTIYLADLDKLITRPTEDQKWTTPADNSPFVAFLNSKKKYLEPAMENCQDISTRVWTDFMEDALAQIKLAQGKKLEEMRQSCTSLTTQCITNTAKSISEFDARALSIFGVSADRTVNEMCASIQTSCTALLQASVEQGDSEWVGGMSAIATDKTYDTIIQTCREIGKACIIQTCKSIAGNFGLCESLDRSINRKAIINHTSCWNEVLNCVSSAGDHALGNIMTQLGKTPTSADGLDNNFYTELYGTTRDIKVTTSGDRISCDPATESCVFDLCSNCGKLGQTDCATCRLAERIWGNCEFIPEKQLTVERPSNRIKQPVLGTETLLSWFAENTGTKSMIDNCRDTTCPSGYTMLKGVCENNDDITEDKQICPMNKFTIATVGGKAWQNCCNPEDDEVILDSYGNCCTNTGNGTGAKTPIYGIDITVTSGLHYYVKDVTKNTPNAPESELCTPPITTPASNNLTFVATQDFSGGYYAQGSSSNNVQNHLVCRGELIWTPGGTTDQGTPFPNGDTIKCTGEFIVINSLTGAYISPMYTMDANGTTPRTGGDSTNQSQYNSYRLPDDLSCLYDAEIPNTEPFWDLLNRADGSIGEKSPSCGSNVVPNINRPNQQNNNLFITY